MKFICFFVASGFKSNEYTRISYFNQGVLKSTLPWEYTFMLNCVRCHFHIIK